MSNPQLRTLVHRVGARAVRAGASTQVSPLLASKGHQSVSARSYSQDRVAALQSRGILDNDGLVNFDTLHELRLSACQAHEENDLFGTFAQQNEEDGSFEWMTYKEFDALVDKTRSVLKDLGVEEFSKVGLIANNRWEWAAVASASYSLNATVVPMYEAQLPDDWTYIINDSGCTALFCATEEIYSQVKKEVLPATPSVKATLCFDGALGEPHAFSTALESASPDSAIIHPSSDDLADLIYTSGTTGKPKGVELTHSNLVSNVKAGVRTMVKDPSDFIHRDDRTLAFLPWAHSYGQTCELWGCMSQGASMGIGRGVPNILEDLQMVKPSILFAVPTLYKRIYDGVHNMMESSSPVRKALMKKALNMGRRRADAEAGLRGNLGPLEKLQLSVLDRVVLDKIRDRFGGNLKHAFVAGAACPAEVLDFMDDLGIPVCEGYGLTETSPIIAINTPENRRNGYVGRPIGDVDVFIMDENGKEVPLGEEGEICCSGPNVMRSYYNNQEATDEVISTGPTGERMFHTGDLGRLEDGWLKVTGRLKEQYKLENGKYVVPTPIEEAIGMSRFIAQVVLFGANKPRNVALLVPEWTAIRAELHMNDPNEVTDEDLANDKRVKSLIDAEIVANCWRLKKFEVPTEWSFVAPFTAANNMLTPKMSIRRHKVIQTYKNVIADLYGEEHEEEEDSSAAKGVA